MTAANRRTKRSRTWCSERFIEALPFDKQELEEHLEGGRELLRRRRVLDFFITPGCASVKVQTESGASGRLELRLRQFTSAEWQLVFRELAGEALFYGALLSGDLPEEAESGFVRARLQLFPSDEGEVALYMENEAHQLSDEAGALIWRLMEQLETNPFALFLLRGRGKEEALQEIRAARQKLRAGFAAERSAESREPQTKTEAPELPEDLDRFFKARSELWTLSYSIRADELPASILRRMNSLPLGGLEDDVERALEEAYAEVAKRAQAYGLSMK